MEDQKTLAYEPPTLEVIGKVTDLTQGATPVPCSIGLVCDDN